MQKYANSDLQGLVDQLTSQTALYYRMLAYGCTEEEFKTCKENIAQLQEAIEKLKKTGGGTSITSFTNE